MKPRLLPQLLLMFLWCTPISYAKLLPVSLEEFREKAPCGLIVEVTEVVPFEFASPPETAWLKTRNRLARLRVEDVLVTEGSDCPARQEERLFLFATEVHSAHPAVGDRAVVFLAKEDGHLVEAVYGRSYWLVKELQGDRYVEIDWRNDFLIHPFSLGLSGETAYLPLSAIAREWSSGEK